MKIVVVGGGTAGWLAALMISKIRPEHKVTVIESSKIGIIGAGEGSTGSLTNIVQNEMWNLGCVEEDFVRECDLTGGVDSPGLGLRFKSSSHRVVAPYEGDVAQPRFSHGGVDSPGRGPWFTFPQGRGLAESRTVLGSLEHGKVRGPPHFLREQRPFTFASLVKAVPYKK